MFPRSVIRLLLALTLLSLQACFVAKPVLQKAAYNERRHYYEQGTTTIKKDTIHYTYDGHIIVPVKLNNDTTTHKYIVDNGLNSIIANDDAKKLGLRPLTSMTAYDANRNIQAFSVYQLDSLKLGAQTFYNYGFNGGDELKTVPNKGINGVDGFIGLNIMKQGVWSFNNISAELIIAKSIEDIPADRKTYRIPLKRRYDRWFVTLTIDGVKTKAILDLGYNGNLLLPKKMMAKIKPKHLLTYYGLTNHTLGGANYDTLHYYREAELKLGDPAFEAGNKMICFSNSELALLGVGFFTQYCFTIDLAHNIMYLAPLASGMPQKLILKTWGLNISRQGADWLVSSLLKDSEAEKAGIHIGDQLISVNNTKLLPDERLNYKLVNDALEGNEPLNLELLRNEIPMKFVLKQKFEY